MKVNMPKVQKRVGQSGLMLERLDSKGMSRSAGRGLNKKGFADASMVSPKMNEPMSASMFLERYGLGQQFYGQLDVNKSKEYREYMQNLCRLYYDIHPLVGSMIDIYSTFPIQGMDITCRDAGYEAFYKDVFFEKLNYETFMRDIGKEYFTIGECFTMADWDDTLGIYTDEYILSPSMFEVSAVPLTSEFTYEMIPTEDMKKLMSSQQPKEAYDLFIKTYGDIAEQIARGENITIDKKSIDHLLRKSKPNDWRGTPILKRAFRVLAYEDRLDSAMKAIVDRMYAPLLMFKLGLPDVGGQPWIPTPENIDEFREELDDALAADFRAIITHVGVDSKEIMSAKSMSAMKSDRDMIDERIMMCFGLSSDIFKPSNTTYASSALRMELATQTLSMYQRDLVEHFNKRATEIAKANEFYDYEIVGGDKKVIEETVRVYNEETGKVEEQKEKKLLLPKLSFKSINFRDADNQRDFLIKLREKGVPIPDSQLLVGVDVDFDDLITRQREENIQKKLSGAKEIKSIALAAVEEDLPIPDDVVKSMVGGQPTDELKALIPDKQDSLSLIVGEESTATEDTQEEKAVDAESATGDGARPNVSDNQKKDMPKP